MADEALKKRLEKAAASGVMETFTSDDVIPADWIRTLAIADQGHPKGLWIKGATIKGRLDFEDCTLSRPLWLDACSITDGITLTRAKAKALGVQNCPLIGGIEGGSLDLGGSLLLHGSTIQGRVFLIGAKIGSDLDCSGATLDGGDAAALYADGLHVGEDLSLGDKFSAKGTIRLLGARIGGNLDCSNATLDGVKDNALQADGLEVKGGLFLREGFSAKGVVDFSHARIGILVDKAVCWPDLILTGLTYDSIGPSSPQTAELRLQWLARRQNIERFDPQPYEQLAKVLKATGHDGEARKILVAKENERLRKGEMGWFHRLMWAVYGVISGYGYRRFRPLIWMAVIIALGMGVFGAAKQEGLMVPAKERVYMEMFKDPDHPKPLPKQYPRLNPLIYSADLFLPFVDLAQDGYWMPSSVGKWGRWVTFYMWGHIAMGWIVSALFVAGITGLVKRE